MTVRNFNKKKLLYGTRLGKLITPESAYIRRRDLIGSVMALSTLAYGKTVFSSQEEEKRSNRDSLSFKKNSSFHPKDKLTSFKDVTSYNNFYEFGTRKGDPSRLAPNMLKTKPWSIVIDGLVEKEQRVSFEKLLALSGLEERIYKLRCVEGWSMVIPWIGYSLSELIKFAKPLGSAKYIAFRTLADREMMPGIGGFRPVLNWPYTEGLRMDEALNPLTFLTFGLYGKTLPEQNGAPIRLVIPWKYGFKGAKSIVRITFLESQPTTSWVEASPTEYGFYSNVNPLVNHPRWSQSMERRIGSDSLFTKKIPTQMFNGYGELVEQLYAGMNLEKFF